MAKYPKLILFIAGVAVILVAVLVETRNGADTGDWPVYRNDKYGFTIKYPPGWRFSEFTDEPVDGREGPTFKTHYINFSKRGFSSPDVELHYKNSLEIFDENLDTIADFFTGDQNEPRPTLVANETHNGIAMAKYSSDLPVESKYLFYIFQRNDTVYVFHTYGVFDAEMLDSLAFLD